MRLLLRSHLAQRATVRAAHAAPGTTAFAISTAGVPAAPAAAAAVASVIAPGSSRRLCKPLQHLQQLGSDLPRLPIPLLQQRLLRRM